MFGLGVAPGLYAQFGMQYAIGLDGSKRSVSEALDGTNLAPSEADTVARYFEALTQ